MAESKLSNTISTFPNQKIEVINNVGECRKIVEILKSHCVDFNVVGFDCEWVRSHNNCRPVALLQLTSHTGLCALFRLCRLRHIPKELKNLLEDENIIKVGIIPEDDAKLLRQDYDVNVTSTLDLRYMANAAGCRHAGLKRMSEEYLKIKLVEPHWRIFYKWEDRTLGQELIEYAANDAHASIELFNFFANQLQVKGELEEQSTYIQHIITEYCSVYLNKKYEDSNQIRQLTSNQFQEISTEEECRTFMQTFKSHCDEFKVIGFGYDIDLKQGVPINQESAALRLSSFQGLCGVVYLRDLKILPQEVKDILQDNHITKIGVFPSDSATILLDNHDVRIAKTFDLRFMAETAGCKPLSMKKMSEKHLIDGDFPCKRFGLFKVFAEKIRKKEELDEQTSYDCIIDKYCSKNFDVEYDASKMNKKLTIEMIDNLEKCGSLIQILKSHCAEYAMLGFDCKWTPKARLPVAALQLSSHEGLCLVFRLNVLKIVPPELKEILEDCKIMKVGIATKQCADHLLSEYGVQVSSGFDIRYMSELAEYQATNLNKMCSDHLKIMLGNYMGRWESPTLSKYQIDYAAKCAYLPIELFQFFAEKLQSKSSSKGQSLSMQRIIEELCKKYFNKSYDCYDSGYGKPSQNNKSGAGTNKKKAPIKPRRFTKKSAP